MSQSLTFLSRNLISLVFILMLSACNGSYTAFESDRDLDNDSKTVDIEQDNAELKMLAVLQSAFVAHYQSKAYEFLDASDLPVNATPTGVANQFYCTGSGDSTIEPGTVTYIFDRGAGETHKKGDEITVEYDACIEGAYTYNGSMTGKYTKIEGLNKRFVDVTTEQCLVELQDDLSMNSAIADTYTYDPNNEVYIHNGTSSFLPGSEINISNKSVIVLSGDELTFTKVANDIRIDLLTTEVIIGEDDLLEKVINLELSFFLSEDDKALFILQPETVITESSIDEDQVYSLIAAEDKEEACQGFERTLSVRFDDFSTLKDDIYTALNGKVTLFEAQESSNRVNQSFIDSDFETVVRQGNVTNVFKMKDYTVEKAMNVANNSYAYEFEGDISNSSVLGGQLELTTLGKLFGSFSRPYPSTGLLQVLARGLESMIVRPDNLKLALQIDYNGDSTGNGLGDIDMTINTTWAELFAREFKE